MEQEITFSHTLVLSPKLINNFRILFGAERQSAASVTDDEYHPRKNLMFTVGLRYDWQNYFRDNNNFAPRLSFAYSPDKNQKTVIRGVA